VPDLSVLLSAGVIVAVIGAATSLVVAFLTRRAQLDVAKINNLLEQGRIRLSSNLENQRGAEQARREYEYDARKRLYSECEPLLFQAVELAQNARHRIESLARSARTSDIRADGTGWLARHGYYYQSTAFFLLAPMTTYKMLQRRITAIDLRLEPGLHAQYELLRLLYQTFGDDFQLAGLDETKYDPDKADATEPNWQALRADQPAVFARQGFYVGTLEMLVEGLIATSGPPRCKTFGEFSADFERDDRNGTEFTSNLQEVFEGFHPKRKPILWRVLIAQVALYDAFINAQTPDSSVQVLLNKSASGFGTPDQVKLFDWRSPTQPADEQEAVGVFPVVRKYLDHKRRDLENRLQPSGSS
jgi:hypothetical protein